MLVYTASIDSRRFLLGSEQEVARLKAEVLQAVRDGGAFIEARSTAKRVTSVLVTGATPVSFDVLEADSEAADHLVIPFPDYDAP